MSKEYTAQQGDCIESIAEQHGFFGETLWSHPDNAELKALRGDPNVLLPGDVVFIPEKRSKSVNCASGKTHQFRKRGVPFTLKLRLLEDGEPRANEPYVLEFNGCRITGTTSPGGEIEQKIAPDVRVATLFLGEDGEEEYELEVGHVDPVTEISGVQGRLRNLGQYQGPIDGVFGDETRSALKRFQIEAGLEADGTLTDEVRNKLKEAHKS